MYRADGSFYICYIRVTGLKSSLTKCFEPMALVSLCESAVGTMCIVATDFNLLV